MCGRYAAAKDPAALVEEFEIGGPPRERLSPDFNVAPTKPVYIVVERPGADDRPERCLDVARWGLIPSWAKDAAIGSRLINARVETLADKPAFRTAYARRRCIVPADGFYEWYVPTDGGSTRRKQPFYIHPADGSSLAMAGLYERWRDPSLPDDDAGAWRTSCTVITTAASEAVRHIHDRMPMTVARRDWATWLAVCARTWPQTAL